MVGSEMSFGVLFFAVFLGSMATSLLMSGIATLIEIQNRRLKRKAIETWVEMNNEAVVQTWIDQINEEEGVGE